MAVLGLPVVLLRERMTPGGRIDATGGVVQKGCRSNGCVVDPPVVLIKAPLRQTLYFSPVLKGALPRR